MALAIKSIRPICWLRRNLDNLRSGIIGLDKRKKPPFLYVPGLEKVQTVKHYSIPSPFLTLEDKDHVSKNQILGMVAAVQVNYMRVIVQSNSSEISTPNVGVELLCGLTKVFKKLGIRVLAGDKVVVEKINWVDRTGVIKHIFERMTETLKPNVANVDHLLVVLSMEQPKILPYPLTMFLVEAESTGIPFTLALNKVELVSEETLQMWKSRLHKWGYKAVFCSVKSKHGLDTLQDILKEQTSVIAGPSGAGKSSLINALRNIKHDSSPESENSIVGSKLSDEQRVGEISTRTGKGIHTTCHVSLLPLSGGGYLADTPGFSMPSFEKVRPQSLAQYFPEIQRILNESESRHCSWKHCLHLGELGCIVQGNWERYPHYLKLFERIRKMEGKRLKKFGKGYLAGNMEESRLESAKYRRQSRKKTKQSLLDDLDDEENDY